jgi:hypothetical protein
MTARKIAYWFAAACALIAPSVAFGQAEDAFCDVNCYHDMQWFSPVDFDFDCQPIDRGCGYTFNYSRVSWYVDNERSQIGAPGAVELSEDLFPEELGAIFGNIDGPPQRYLIQNSLQDVTPGDFGGGDRYELGYFSGQHSVMIGVLFDQTVQSFQSFGNGPMPSGFGSIHINFELQNPDLLLGFRSYGGVFVEGQGSDADVPTPTVGGPGSPLPNNVVDDLNGNLAEGGTAILGDLNGDGTIDDDEIIGIAIDYGDLYLFNVRFNEVFVRNTTRTDSVEIMKNYVLDNDHWFKTEQNGQIEVGAGVRFLRIRDEFGFSGTSDFFRGETPLTVGNVVNTDVDNQIVGPQIFARYTKQQHRLGYGIGGRFMFGYNIQDLDQNGVLGENVLPGGLNQPNFQPTAFNYGRQDNDFAPVVELRADANYRLTDAIALKLGYTAVFADNITRAASVTRWRLPDMGFNESGEQHILINGVDAGFELTY